MSPSYHTYWRELASGTRSGFSERLLILLLAPVSLVYSLVQRLRTALYQIGIFKTNRLPRPVISIGNITVGGTGKTPVTAHIARILMERGYRVAVLSRGYGGSLEGHAVVVSDGATVMLGPTECGDEPFLLASAIPGLMVVIGTDRYAAGMLAMQQLSPDIFLLDDGFQHLRLYRELNILLLDSSRPFGNGWTLPAGLMREPHSALSRADLIINTRHMENSSAISPAGGIPNCSASHRINALIPLLGGSAAAPSAFIGKKLLAFAGIAEPVKFFDDLRALGLNLVHTISFSDHTDYSDSDITSIIEEVRSSGAEMGVTTEKDGVKLRKLRQVSNLQILLARLELSIDDPAPLMNSLSNLLQK